MPAAEGDQGSETKRLKTLAVVSFWGLCIVGGEGGSASAGVVGLWPLGLVVVRVSAAGETWSPGASCWAPWVFEAGCWRDPHRVHLQLAVLHLDQPFV